MIRSLCLLAGAMLLLMPCANAAEKRNVVVMGEDAGEHAPSHTVVVARDTRVFRQVMEAITEQLTEQGFSVYDERAVSLDHFRQDRVGRGEAELLDIARSVQRPPIDAVVLFTAYAGARRLSYTTDVYARISGRILDVRTGEKLGGFEVTSPGGWKAPIACDRDCLVEEIGAKAKLLAADLGAVLAQQLSTALYETGAAGGNAAPKTIAPALPGNGTRPTGFTLVFAGFSPDEISDVEEYLVAFRGYKLHRPVTSTPRNMQYWYEIDSDSARLSRNLRMMLDRIGAEGRLSFASSNNTFTVEKAIKLH